MDVETYDLSTGATRDRSPAASAHLRSRPMLESADVADAREVFPNGALGWDERRRCCVFKVCGSVYEFPLAKTRSGVVCTD